MTAGGWLACAGAAGTAGWLYWRTLLPGLDLGDTASFQTIATLPLLVPRHAYPLYFALAKLSVAVHGGEPAAALNVLSAVTGACAVAALAWLIWEFTRRAMAALWGGLLLAGSYTFWSQAVIAEVYALQVLFIAVVLAAAVRWWRRPTLARLAWLYALYALSFGNHLTMILFAPALFWVLWSRGVALPPRDHPFGVRGLALALAAASAGALQYAWNFAGLWALSKPQPPIQELLAIFWFDVTKADWRESLVGTVPPAQLADRAGMYWWDLQQQFGLAGIALAAIGAVVLARAGGRVGGALLIAYITTLGFAFFYNVGDTHVFLLPSHALVVLWAAIGVAVLLSAARHLRGFAQLACGLLLTAVPIMRIADTAPAVDRSRDHRAEVFAASLLEDLTPQHAIALTDLNWQLANAVAYYATVHRPELPRTHTGAVLWRLPELVRRNHELGRDVVLTAPAAERVTQTYGSVFPLTIDPRLAIPPLEESLRVERGAPYVLAWLTPLPLFPVDQGRLDRASLELAGRTLPSGRYVVMAGRAGHPPTVAHASNRPFRLTTQVGGLRVEVRIDAWLPFDTMRRAGFGHAIVNGRHTLTLERGLSFVLLDDHGGAQRIAYAGGIFTPQPRYLIPVLR
jgi:hypothetical protein